MSTELLPCPCCNGKAITSDGGFGPVNQDEVFSVHFIECVDCDLMISANTIDEAICLWNRRFACLDKNEDPVCVGDKVKYKLPNWKNKFKDCYVTEFRPPFYGYGLTADDDSDFTAEAFLPFEIELVKEAT